MKKIVSDLVMGSVLKLINEESNQFKVMYPDGRIGWVDGSKFIKYSSFDELKNDYEIILKIYFNTLFVRIYFDYFTRV